jgi:nucleotide-binding universal stress UspA family protein
MTCRILVAVDGSPSSEAALSEVGRMMRGGASVHFLHVIPLLPLNVSVTPAGVLAGYDQAVSYLGSLRERWPDVRGLDLIRTGDPADAILQAASEFNIDLVAMGMGKGFLGSAAATVLRGAQLPVLLGRTGFIPGQEGLRRILVPLDGSSDALTILPIIQNLAIGAAAEVVFLHVSGHGTPEDPREKILSLADRLEKSDLAFWQTVAHGDAVEEIVSHAETLEVDLIAMSTQARNESECTIVGRSASAVLERSPRSMLLQRPPATPEDLDLLMT